MDHHELELEHMKASALERDAVLRLYYALWIVFLGGFVLSLRISYGELACLAKVLVAAFRLLAVVGTLLNFWMQYHAIRGSSYNRREQYARSDNNKRMADNFHTKMEDSANAVEGSQPYLIIVGTLFLMVALILSFSVTLS
jgi:hypothetical protein